MSLGFRRKKRQVEGMAPGLQEPQDHERWDKVRIPGLVKNRGNWEGRLEKTRSLTGSKDTAGKGRD